MVGQRRRRQERQTPAAPVRSTRSLHTSRPLCVAQQACNTVLQVAPALPALRSSMLRAAAKWGGCLVGADAAAGAACWRSADPRQQPSCRPPSSRPYCQPHALPGQLSRGLASAGLEASHCWAGAASGARGCLPLPTSAHQQHQQRRSGLDGTLPGGSCRRRPACCEAVQPLARACQAACARSLLRCYSRHKAVQYAPALG